MAITCWDSFTGHNWERYSGISAMLSIFACLFFSILTFILEYDVGIGVYTLFVGLIMIPLETTWMDCIKPFFLCREFFNETLKFRNPALKGVMYTLMSILMFALVLTPCVGSGIFLLVTAILMFFAQCNKIQDEADEARASKSSTKRMSINEAPSSQV